MPPVQEPVQTTDPATPVDNGSLAGESTATPPVSQPAAPQTDPVQAELERVKAELNKAQMRANQLDNERKTAEAKRLEEQGKWQELAEQRQAEIDRIAAEREEANRLADAKRLRDGVIASYEDEKTRTIAQKMLEKNPNLFYWGDDASDETSAQAQVKAQLDDIKGYVAPEPEQPANEVKVDANNPIEASQYAAPEDLKALENRVANISF